MATKDEKDWALSTAVNIIAKAAEGGYEKITLSSELSNLYDTLVALIDKKKEN